MNRHLVDAEIGNFIFYAFSDDEERKQFMKCKDDYMREVYEEVAETRLEE